MNFTQLRGPGALHFGAAALLIAFMPMAAKKPADNASSFRQKLKPAQQIEHALSRLTFGARPGDLEAVQAMGLKKWINMQLNPASIEENSNLEAVLASMPTLSLPQEELSRRYPSLLLIRAIAEGRQPFPEDPELKEIYRRLVDRYEARKKNNNTEQEQAAPDGNRADGIRTRIAALSTGQRSQALRRVAPQQAIATELTEAKIYRAVLSERQLQEVLTDFWFNHFNVFLEKGADRWLTTSYEREAIRPHVLGKFKDLLLATARSPAMLFYLDNWTSISPDTPQRLRRTTPKARARGINENYARELLELHTLGVDGGYSQKDVQEVARCFTGWTIAEPGRSASFRFAPMAHDRGEKVVLGVKIPSGGGMEDGLKVIELLAGHPSTAKFISTRLAQRFVADEPPPALVERMARKFQQSGGDIREVMREMLASPEFFSVGAYRSKLKSPLEMVAGSLRATGARLTSAMAAAQAIANMGQPLYRKVEPTGYSNNGEDWLNSAGLLARMNFALSLSENRLPGVQIDRERFATIAKEVGAPQWQRR